MCRTFSPYKIQGGYFPVVFLYHNLQANIGMLEGRVETENVQ